MVQSLPMDELVGIVLAAGLSRRMGKPKQLLPWGDRTLLQHVVGCACRHLEHVIVVVGHRRDEIETTLASWPVRCVFNPAYAEGMLSSVRAGIAAAEAKAFVFFLGDQPNISSAAIDAVLQGWRRTDKGVVIPTHAGKRGHPVLLAARYRKAVEEIPAGQGLNTVTRGYPQDTLEVPVGEEGVLIDMDTPEDYQREYELNHPANPGMLEPLDGKEGPNGRRCP